MSLHALKYCGGKSLAFRKSIGKWIADMLPYDCFYIEPFAGMLGVLLQRQKSKIEIINDKNGLISNFWECIRDHPEELEWKFVNAPLDRKLFKKSIEIKNNFINGCKTEPVDCAFASGVILLFGFSGIISSQHCRIYEKQPFVQSHKFAQRILALHDRLIGVRIENKDAFEILDKCKNYTDAIIYCDPPYPNTINCYEHNINSIDEFIYWLRLQKGKVVVSGYDNDFDNLDWHKEIKNSSCTIGTLKENSNKSVKRQTSVWLNYRPKTQQTLFDL